MTRRTRVDAYKLPWGRWNTPKAPAGRESAPRTQRQPAHLDQRLAIVSDSEFTLGLHDQSPRVSTTKGPRIGGSLPTIDFQNSAVAFVDILGFCNLVHSATTETSKREELEELVGLLEGVVPLLDCNVDSNLDKSLIPKHIYVSDCIVLSAPLLASDPTHKDYDGLAAVVLRCVQITHRLLERGYLVCGGIAVGPVWQTANNIVGPAYANAYKTERKTGRPRIELTDEAKCKWRQNTALQDTRLCIEYDGVFMVNGLHHWYSCSTRERLGFEATFCRYKDLAVQGRSRCATDKARSKWDWFRSYIDFETKQI